MSSCDGTRPAGGLYWACVGAVRLMTNNPEKVAQLEAEGIRVIERLPLALPHNPHNERYLATKRDRTGHQL